MPAKSTNLLAYLLIKKGRSINRLVLASQFWPEATERQARHAVSQAIWHIHSQIPGLLQTELDKVGIYPNFPIQVDVAEFENLVQSCLSSKGVQFPVIQNLERAIELYQGNLIEGCYDDWIVVERERLRELYFLALEHLIPALKTACHYDRALEMALRLANADPLRESAHREAMRLFHHLGRPEAALKQFEAFRQILKHELALDPEPETIALSQEIAQRKRTSPLPYLPEAADLSHPFLLEGAADPNMPLIGRARERAELVKRLEMVGKGCGGMTLLEGEAGVGKSRLIKELARDAEWRGIQVLQSKADEPGMPRQHGILVDALAGGLSPLRAEQLQQVMPPLWLQVLGSYFPALLHGYPDLPALAPLEPTQEQIRLIEALVHLLMDWARINPLLVMLEDLHWADEHSLDLLLHLLPRLSQERVFWVGSYRGEEARLQPGIWEKLQALDCSEFSNRVILTGLDSAASHELIHYSLGGSGLDEGAMTSLCERTRGNPLFILEVLRDWYDEGRLIKNEDGKWSLPTGTADETSLPLSPSLDQAIGRRLEQLPPDLRRTLNSLSVLGNNFDFQLLIHLDISPTQSLLSSLNDLVQKRLLTEVSRGYGFSHDKLHEVFYARIENSERKQLHATFGEKMEACYPERVGDIARHYLLGEVWAKALTYQKRAAEQAHAANAYAVERRYLDSAIEALEHLRDPAGPSAEQTAQESLFDLLGQRLEVLEVLGLQQAQAADVERMVSLAQGDALRLSKIYRSKASLLANATHFEEAEQVARQAVALVEKNSEPADRVLGLIALGSVIRNRGDPERALPFLQQAVETASRFPDRTLEARARAALTIALSYNQHQAARLEAQQVLGLYEQLHDPRGQVEILDILGIISMEQGDPQPAIQAYSKAIEIAEKIGYQYGLARSRLNLANIYFVMKQIGPALQHYTEARQIFQVIGNRRAEILAQLNIITARQCILGENETIRPEVEAALADAEAENDLSTKLQCLVLLGNMARLQKNFAVARAALNAAVTEGLKVQDIWMVVSAYNYLVALALDEGDPAAAAQSLQAAEAICQEKGLDDLATILLSSRGKVLLAQGQPQAALEATCAAMQRLNPGIEAGYLIPLQHYQVLSSLGRRAEAQAAIEQAYQMLSEMLETLTVEQQKMSRENVAEHRSILEAWQAAHPHTIRVRLPRCDAPTGRPLRSDEYVEVTWTVFTPEDEAIPDKVARRHTRLQRLLSEAAGQGAKPTQEQLAEALGVSLRTLNGDMVAIHKEP